MKTLGRRDTTPPPFSDRLLANHIKIVKIVGPGTELVGAAAMAIHGVVQATEGLDLFVRPTAENVALLKKDTVRPPDRQDAEALRRRFDLEEE